MTQSPNTIQIHETAFVDPSAVLQGTITIGAWSLVEPGVVMRGNITVGEHSAIHCGTVLRGRITIGNYVQIFDQVCIESGRGPNVGTAVERDQTFLKDGAWINHGAAM